MRLRILKSYYSRLTLFSLTVLFLLVLLLTGVAMYYLWSSRESAVMSEYDSCMQELVQEYEDIHKEYYKVFHPFYQPENLEDLATFYAGNNSGMSSYGLHYKINQLLKQACKQDERIKGIYFRSLSSGDRYLYVNGSASFVNVYYEPGGLVAETEQFQRIVIGARTMDFDKPRAINVFGIQSGILMAGESKNAPTYQLVVFYALDSFEHILEKYQLNSDVRFLLTSIQGEIIYDSYGEYAYDEVSYYENSGLITGEKEDLREEANLYLKRESYRQNMYLAFYTVQQNSIRFQFDGSMLLVILLSIVVCGLVTLIMLMFNRLLRRRFEEIECGMEQIGKNKLDYRMPVSKQEDEFTRIAIRFNQMCDDLEDVINQNYVYELLRQKAEYKALQGTVNPHFLYNSLEAIREKLAEDGQEDSSEMIVLLSRIFEYQIRGDNMVSVRKELGLLQTYIEFTSIRYQYAFEYSIDFEEQILDCTIPKLIFQPILENYFVHGFRGNGNDHIHIKGYLDESNDRIHVSFCDNGKGMSAKRVEQIRADLKEGERDSSHIGLCNVNSRLQIVFGSEGYVDVKINEPEPGVCISLIFGKTTKF